MQSFVNVSRFWRFEKWVLKERKGKKEKKEEKKRVDENERKREKKGKGKKTCSSVIFFVQGKETEFLTYWKVPESYMWLKQSRLKVTFMHKISRMTASLTVTKLKLETESHADEQTFRIKKDAVLTFHDY